mgnify:CR=1 FL=1
MSASIATIIATLSIVAQEAVQKVIDQATSRTLVNRRVEQAEARIAKSKEAIGQDEALIAALKVHFESLPVEAGSLKAKVNDIVTFNSGRKEVVEETGRVVADLGGRYRVIVNEQDPATAEYKTVFPAQLVSVTSPEAQADDLCLDA